jgi:shikimate kinase
VANRALYLIGPSGVGKATCAAAAVETINAKLYELDDLCRGRTNDWSFCQETMLSVEASDQFKDQLEIIDVGAGTQHDCTRALSDFLKARRDRVILIWAPAAEVIKRNPLGQHRRPDEYLSTEYTSREELYSVAPHKLDITGLSKVEAAERFKNHLTLTIGFDPL